MSKRKIKIIIFLSLAIILTIIALLLIKQKYQTTFVDEPKMNPAKTMTLPSETAPTSSPATGYELPTTLLLPVPFTPQAPTANWDKLHNEACEEASAIMAAFYFSPSKIGTDKGMVLDPKTVESEIQKLTEWQQQNFGYHLSINTAETEKMAQEVYGLKTQIINDFTENDIKKALTEGKLVLFPANGRLLYNPNFKSPGPKYHMLVIKGYTQENFITNDPGTKKGLNYPYSFETRYSANGNYDHTTEEVDTTRKNVIVIWK